MNGSTSVCVRRYRMREYTVRTRAQTPQFTKAMPPLIENEIGLHENYFSLIQGRQAEKQ